MKSTQTLNLKLDPSWGAVSYIELTNLYLDQVSGGRSALDQNYPNPFNSSTTLRYGLPSRSRVRLQVYNVLGQIVADFVNAEQAAGWNQVMWNATVASGLYFYRIEAVSVSDPNKRFVDVKKMILLK